MPDWNAGMPHLRVRRSGRRAVPGRTLERGKGRNQVAASIKERNCDRQINKIYRDKMVAYLSSFYGTVASNSRRTATLGRGHPIIGPKMLRGNYRAEMPVLNVVRFAHFGRVEQCPEMSQRFEPVSKSPIGLAAPRPSISPTLRQSEPLRSLKRS